MTDEKKLVSRLQKDDMDALNEAVEIYTPYFSTVLYNIFGNNLSKEDAEEILSDVFVMLWKNAEYINLKKGTVRSYMSAVAKNAALKRMGKEKHHVLLEEFTASCVQDYADDIDEHTVWKAVMMLGEPDNKIFVRYYKFEKKLRDISKAMGLNLSTVKTKLSRGRNKLKILLNAEEI